jgi:hypothetical protein
MTKTGDQDGFHPQGHSDRRVRDTRHEIAPYISSQMDQGALAAQRALSKVRA